MKLVGSLLCVSALAVVGCGDVESVGGGQGEGITPAKVGSLDPDDVESQNPRVDGLKQIKAGESADNICPDCQIVAFSVANNDAIDEVRVVQDAGSEVCRIYLKDDAVVIDECGWMP